jgi:hypothetical protein
VRSEVRSQPTTCWQYGDTNQRFYGRGVRVDRDARHGSYSTYLGREGRAQSERHACESRGQISRLRSLVPMPVPVLFVWQGQQRVHLQVIKHRGRHVRGGRASWRRALSR